MRILITNATLASRTGTETSVRDIAVGLLRRGHQPVVYSPDPGVMAAEIRRATVPVVDRLDRLGVAPDIVHGHHAVETATALLRFPDVPGIFFCHDWSTWWDEPPRLPRLVRYVAVDETVRGRLVDESGIAPERVTVLLNFIDLERFRRRATPLPARPGRALVFSNYAAEDGYLSAVRAACAAAGLPLDVAGAAAGRVLERPEEVLGGYDLVFAKAKAALEALATGAAVILCDAEGSGPLVTSDNLAALRRSNLGRRCLDRPLAADRLAAEIARYDAADAARVGEQVRSEAGLTSYLEALERLYAEAIAAGAAARPTAEEELRAAADFLWACGPRWNGDWWRAAAERREQELTAARAEMARLREEVPRELEAEAARLRGLVEQERRLVEDERRHLEQERRQSDRLADELAFVRSTAAWRLRERLLSSRYARLVYRALRRPFRRRARGAGSGAASI